MRTWAIVLVVLAAAPASAQQARDAPYDWPFRARSVEISSFARAEVALSTNHEAGGSARHGYAMTQLYSAGIAVDGWLLPFVRGGFAFQHDRFDQSAAIFGNLEVGASAIARVGTELRVGGHLSLFLPTGSGQGAVAPFAEQLAQQEGARTRMGTDSSLFLTNHVGAALSGTFAYVGGGIVAQVELGLEGLWRVNGAETGALAPIGAVHVAGFVLPELSLAIELTHHQWALGQPAGGSPRSITSVLVGARAHATIGSVALRPGVSYSHALGGPIEAADYHVLQFDLVIDL